MRELEAAAEKERLGIEAAERELANWRPAASADLAARWFGLLEGIEALETEARMQARELMRASFSRIVVWHSGDPAGAEDGHVFDLSITARGGGTMRLRVDRATGGLIE